MVNLTFGEQVKIILGRKGMTIKELAELVEQRTGKPMSRQNMTQRLGRDNFQEQDMRLIADILGCKFQLSIMEMDAEAEVAVKAPVAKKTAVESVTVVETAPAVEAAKEPEEELHPLEREITIGELADMADEVAGLDEVEEVEVALEAEEEISTNISAAESVQEPVQKPVEESDERSLLRKGIRGYFKKASSVAEPAPSVKEETTETPKVGDVNPYTGKEYKTNSVRMHPKRIGYVQVYDQEQHKWTDMTEWAFLGYQERKKALLGKDYEPPIYLD